MSDRFTPYLFFLLAAVIFMVFGAGLQLLLPVQVALILAEVCCILGFALFMRHHWVEPTTMKWPTWKKAGGPIWLLFLTFLSGAIFGLCANLIGGLIVELLPSLNTQAENYAETLDKMLNPGSLPLKIAAIVSVTMAAPLCEEALFRGFLLPLQRERENVALAIMTNGLLFGAIHMNSMGLLSLSLLGMVLAALTVRSKSLWPAIMCHAGVNTCNGVLVPMAVLATGADPATSQPPLSELLMGLSIFLVLSAGSLMLLWKAYGKYGVQPHES